MKAFISCISLIVLYQFNLNAQVNGKIVSPSFSSVSSFVSYSFNSLSSSIVITNKSSYKLEAYNIYPESANSISNELATILPGESTEIPANYKGAKCFRAIVYKASDMELKTIPGESQDNYTQRYNENQHRGCELVKLQAQMGKEICQAINGTASCYSDASSILETNNWCDNSSSQASNNKTQSNNNVFGGTNQNSTTNRNNPVTGTQTNLQKTQQSINSSIDDITNSVIADMNKNHEEELKQINESYNNSQNNSNNQGLRVEALSNDKSNAEFDDGYFPINYFSDVSRFINTFSVPENKFQELDKSKTFCNTNGILTLVILLPQSNEAYEDIFDLKKISTSSFVIAEGSDYVSLYFTGDGVKEVKYYRKGKLKDEIKFNRGFFTLDKNLLNANKQYILRGFIESLSSLITGKSLKGTIDINTLPKKLSEKKDNNPPAMSFSDVAKFIVGHDVDLDEDRTYCSNDGMLHIGIAGTTKDKIINLKNVDPNSLIVRNTGCCVYLYFKGKDGVEGEIPVSSDTYVLNGEQAELRDFIEKLRALIK